MKIFLATAVKENTDRLEEVLGGYGKVIVYAVGNKGTEQSVSSLLADIRSADAFVAEMSRPSHALGFAMAYANLHFVPCLYLYESDTKPSPDALFTHNPSRKLWTKRYTDGDLEGILRDFITMVERQMETARTSFMSTREIDDFIAKASETRGISKGEVIRQALSEIAKKIDH